MARSEAPMVAVRTAPHPAVASRSSSVRWWRAHPNFITQREESADTKTAALLTPNTPSPSVSRNFTTPEPQIHSPKHIQASRRFSLCGHDSTAAAVFVNKHVYGRAWTCHWAMKGSIRIVANKMERHIVQSSCCLEPSAARWQQWALLTAGRLFSLGGNRRLHTVYIKRICIWASCAPAAAETAQNSSSSGRGNTSKRNATPAVLSSACAQASNTWVYHSRLLRHHKTDLICLIIYITGSEKSALRIIRFDNPSIYKQGRYNIRIY